MLNGSVSVWIEMRGLRLFLLKRSGPQRPVPEALPRDLNKSRKPVRLFDEEYDDQYAKEDLLKILELPDVHADGGERTGRVGQRDGQQHNESRTAEVARDTAHPADDDDEQHLERQVEVEAVWLDRAEISERPERACNPDDERTDSERQQLGAADGNADDRCRRVHIAYRHPAPAEFAAHEAGSHREQHRDNAKNEL